MKESIADKTARAYRTGADDAFKQARQQARQELEEARQELFELRELVASQAKTVESLHAALDRFAFRTEDA